MGPSYAGILGPIAFVTMLARGLISGSSTDHSLFLAIVYLVAFAALGFITGTIADRVVLESVKQRFDHELSNQRTDQK
jgi:hypothetical protein